MTTPRRLIQDVIRELDRRFGIEHVGDLSIKLLQADQLLADSERAMNVDPAERWPIVPAEQLGPVRDLARGRLETKTVRRGFRIHQGGRRRRIDESELGLVS